MGFFKCLGPCMSQFESPRTICDDQQVAIRSKALSGFTIRHSRGVQNWEQQPSTELTNATRGKMAAPSDYPVIREALEKLPVFSCGTVSPEMRSSIVANMYEKEVKASGVLILENVAGTSANEMYVVKDGSFDVYQNRAGRNVNVNKKARGDFFGEIALLYSCPRTATIVAKTDAVVWVLDRKNFKSHIRRHHALIRRHENKLITFLNSVYIFQKLDGTEREELSKHFEEVEYASGKRVLEEGADSTHLYIVRAGEAVVERTFNGELTKVDRLFPGDFFGYNCLSLQTTSEQRVSAANGGALKTIRIPAHVLISLPEDVHNRMRRHLKAFSARERFLRLSHTQSTVKLNLTERAGGAGGHCAMSCKTMRGSIEEPTLIDAEDGGTPRSDAGVSTPNDCSGGAVPELDAEVIGLLGSGAYSTIKLIYCPKQKRYFAMKCMNKIRSARIKDHIFSERNLSRLLMHPLVVRLFGCFQNDRELTMLYDYVDGGDLMDLLEASASMVEVFVRGDTVPRSSSRNKVKKKFIKGLDEEIVQFYGASLAIAIQYLHRIGIVHRDIKPENVFIDSDGFIKLGDFGFAKQIGAESTYTFCGTPGYLAPECVLSNGYDRRVDWWSFGVLLYVITTGRQPFALSNNDDPNTIIQRIVDPEFEVTYPPYVGQKLVNLLTRCLERKQKDRIGDHNVQAHAFFSGVNIEDITVRRMKVPGRNSSNIKKIRDKRVAELRLTMEEQVVVDTQDCAYPCVDLDELERVEAVFRDF